MSMNRRKYYLILDTETGIDSSIIDMGGALYTRQSKKEGDPKKLKLVNSFAVLLTENWGRVELFNDRSDSFFSKRNLKRRNDNYKAMLESGARSIANVGAVNRWLAQCVATYGADNIELTAYNLAFDRDKCLKQGIDLSIFSNSFCLWQAALGNIANTKAYKHFCLDNHYFTNRTHKTGHSGMLTNAEVMSYFVTGINAKEPHCSLEDVLYHEAPILERVLRCNKWRDKIKPYTWKHYALRNFYKVK